MDGRRLARLLACSPAWHGSDISGFDGLSMVRFGSAFAGTPVLRAVLQIAAESSSGMSIV
jgi:hypothetical protein